MISFAEFDNWDLISEYNHINQPDGIVDMIIMVYRNIANEFSDSLRRSFITRLNLNNNYGYLDGSEFTVDNGARRVKTGFWPTFNGEPGGSGVTEIDHLLRKNLSVTIHEFSHYLLGGNEMHSGYGAWAMLDDWGVKSKLVNSFERYRLGWINVNQVDSTISQTISNALLPDYLTTGIAYRLNINSAEGFYIENHQKLSYWEQNNTFGQYGTTMLFGNVENGIYVFRQDGLYGYNLTILPADGRYDWVVNQLVANPWANYPDSIPVFKNIG
ncbi:MAG: hypothetical protein K6T54_14185, partial [Ignavibacterium sp.]|nr:hypothetical protein [Ignavibacterium sp.]